MSNVRHDEYGFAVAPKPPRPTARTGSILLMVGGAIHMLAVFLPWYQGAGMTLKGMDTFVTADGLGDFPAPGKLWLVVGGVLLLLGIITFTAGRHLAVAIIGVVVATLGLFTSLLGVGVAKNERDLLGTGDAAIGAFLGIMSIIVALAGSIQVLAKRRR